MRCARRLAPAVLLGAVLAGCGSSSPADELRSKVAAVTDAANARNAGGLRGAVDDLLSTAKLQHDTGKLDLGRYRQIQLYAARVKADADLLQPAPTSTAPRPTTAPTRTTPPVTTPPETGPPQHGKGEGDGKGKGGKGKGKRDASPSPSVSPLLPTGGPVGTPSP